MSEHSPLLKMTTTLNRRHLRNGTESVPYDLNRRTPPLSSFT